MQNQYKGRKMKELTIRFGDKSEIISENITILDLIKGIVLLNVALKKSIDENSEYTYEDYKKIIEKTIEDTLKDIENE